VCGRVGVLCSVLIDMDAGVLVVSRPRAQHPCRSQQSVVVSVSYASESSAQGSGFFCRKRPAGQGQEKFYGPVGTV
jgi:hypothetical protein